MPVTPSPGALPPARRRVRPPRAEADPRNWAFGAKYVYRPDPVLRPSLAFSASSPEVLHTVSPSFAFGAHDWRLTTSSGLRHALVDQLPKNSPIPSRVLQNTFGLKSLFVDESTTYTQFVAFKRQNQNKLQLAKQKLERRRNLLQGDRSQLANREAELGIIPGLTPMQQKAQEEVLAEAARKEDERRQLEREKALKDARENAHRAMEEAKRQVIEAQAAFEGLNRNLEAALLGKKRMQLELQLTHGLEFGVARQRQKRIQSIIKEIEHRQKEIPWATPVVGGAARLGDAPAVHADQLVASEEERQKGRNALYAAKKVIEGDAKRLARLGKELTQLSRQSAEELGQVTENIASVDQHCEGLELQAAEAERIFLAAVQAAEKTIETCRILDDDKMAEDYMQALHAQEEFLHAQDHALQELDLAHGEFMERESVASALSFDEERRGSKSSKGSKIPVSVSVEM